jgi:hypothetical protein
VRGHGFERELRVVFVGRKVEDRKWTLTAKAGGVVPTFVDHRSRELVSIVAAESPDVVVVFGPHRLTRGVAAALPGVCVGFVTDLLPTPRSYDGSPWSSADRLTLDVDEAPMATCSFDASEYDRVMAADPRVARLEIELDIWRSPPLPVDDALYRTRGPVEPGARALFLGESSDWREAFLVGAKHHYELRHYAFGLEGDRLAKVLRDSSIGVVLAPGPWSTFEPAAALHLAADHLLLAGPLEPPRGLEAGLDHLTFHEPEDLLHLLFELQQWPAAFEHVRRRGRVRAEEFRASRIWPRLLTDVLHDLYAFGSNRCAAA